MNTNRDPELDAWIERVLATAPPLTDEKRARLAALLWNDRYQTVIDSDSDDP